MTIHIETLEAAELRDAIDRAFETVRHYVRMQLGKPKDGLPHVIEVSIDSNKLDVLEKFDAFARSLMEAKQDEEVIEIEKRTPDGTRVGKVRFEIPSPSGEATRQAEEVDGWMPIETAPKDGEPVLIASDNFVTVACWQKDEEQWWELNNDPTDHWGDQFYPTHWRPLPPAPGEGKR